MSFVISLKESNGSIKDLLNGRKKSVSVLDNGCLEISTDNIIELENTDDCKVYFIVTYVESVVINDNCLKILSVEKVPESFSVYLSLNKVEKDILYKLLVHRYLYGLRDRDVSNTFADIFYDLLGNSYSDNDLDWFYEYLCEEDETDI